MNLKGWDSATGALVPDLHTIWSDGFAAAVPQPFWLGRLIQIWTSCEVGHLAWRTDKSQAALFDNRGELKKAEF